MGPTLELNKHSLNRVFLFFINNSGHYFCTFIDSWKTTSWMCTTSHKITVFDAFKFVTRSEIEHLIETVREIECCPYIDSTMFPIFWINGFRGDNMISDISESYPCLKHLES